MKIHKCFEKPDLLIKGASEIVANETKKQKDFLTY